MEARVPVAHTRVRCSADLRDGGLFVRKVPGLAVPAEGAGRLREFVPELSPRPGETVVVKQYAPAFFGTSLAALFGWRDG